MRVQAMNGVETGEINREATMEEDGVSKEEIQTIIGEIMEVMMDGEAKVEITIQVDGVDKVIMITGMSQKILEETMDGAIKVIITHGTKVVQIIIVGVNPIL